MFRQQHRSHGNSTSPLQVTHTAGPARRGRITFDETTLETPNLFPVVNFYAGGMSSSLYGGGVHRTIKEFMTGSEAIGGGDYSEYFDCVMTSVSSLTDYNITRERYEDYTAAPIRERGVFQEFDGTLFIDSGGYKFLGDYELDGSNFEVDIDQTKVYEIQQKLGGDIFVNLDRPIAPNDSYEKRVEKARKTAEYVAEFLRVSDQTESLRFLTLHGYNYAMLDTFLRTIDDVLPIEFVHERFDGVALGGLVPLKDNKGKLITAVQECRAVLNDWGFDDLPLHVLGISSSAIPLLVAAGADTFDSSSYLHSAIHGKYFTSLLGSQPLDETSFENCDCPVCSNPELVSRMQGNVEYQKDKLGPVAMHNLITQKREVKRLRKSIEQSGTEGIVDYLESELGPEKSMRTFVHRIVNESLGGYF